MKTLMSICSALFLSVLAFGQSEDLKIKDAIPSGTKWHPGHYLRVVAREDNPEGARAFLAHPKSTGILVEFDWKNLEGAPGVYDFSKIDGYLALAHEYGKVIQIKIQDRGFLGETDANAPAYLKEQGYVVPMYKDGRTKTVVKGSALKWWDGAAMDHFIRLYRELGARYDTHPDFAGVTIGDGESALDVDKSPESGYSGKEHERQIIRSAREVKRVFPHTPVFTGFNWLGVDTLRAVALALFEIKGSGFIHPDTVPGKKFPATDLEIEFGRLGVPTLAGMQTPNLSEEMTEIQMFGWAAKTIGASMVAWNHYRPKRGNYVQTTLLPFLESADSDFPASNLLRPETMKP